MRTLMRNVLAATLACMAMAVQAVPVELGHNGRPVPLAELADTKDPLRMYGANGQYSINIPVSKRESVKTAVLHLEGTNSISLMRERSQLAVRLNNKVVAQITLSPSQPEFAVDIKLPASDFVSGYNKLTFAASQHYTLQCEDPSAPELWSEINGQKSVLNMQTELKPLNPNLSDFETLIDPKLWAARKLNVLTPAQGSMDDERLGWGALVAQGVNLRMQYLPLPIHHVVAAPATSNAGRVLPGLDQTRLADADNVLIGTAQELAQYLNPAITQSISDSFLAVYPLDADPRRFVLIVSGRNPAEVRRAATAFAWLRFAFPQQAATLIKDLDPAKLKDYAAKGRVIEQGAYPFKDLGFVSRTVKGMGAESIELELNMAPDLHVAEDAMVEVELNFAYGAKMRSDSVLNIFLNGRFESAIALDNDQGGFFQRKRVKIPARDFQPGYNKITFSAKMIPLITGNCVLFQTDNLQLSILDDSTLRMPKSFHFTLLPDLKRFAQTAFPFSTQADGSRVAVVLGGYDSQTVGAAWSLIGKVAQKKTVPLWNTQITLNQPESERNVVLVGPRNALNAKLFEGAPWQPGEAWKVSYPAIEHDAEPRAERAWFTRFRAWAFGDLRTSLFAGKPEQTGMTLATGLNQQLVTMQYRSPLDSDYSAIAFTAENPAALWNGVSTLLEPDVWESMDGDVSVWLPGDAKPVTQFSGKRYEAGSIGMMGRLGYYYSFRPWLWVTLSIVLLIALAFLTRKLIRRFHQRQHAHVAEEKLDA